MKCAREQFYVPTYFWANGATCIINSLLDCKISNWTVSLDKTVRLVCA